jgi:hypothetical protein
MKHVTWKRTGVYDITTASGMFVHETATKSAGIVAAKFHAMQIQHPNKKDYVSPPAFTVKVKAKRPALTPLEYAGLVT